MAISFGTVPSLSHMSILLQSCDFNDSMSKSQRDIRVDGLYWQWWDRSTPCPNPLIFHFLPQTCVLQGLSKHKHQFFFCSTRVWPAHLGLGCYFCKIVWLKFQNNPSGKRYPSKRAWFFFCEYFKPWSQCHENIIYSHMNMFIHTLQRWHHPPSPLSLSCVRVICLETVLTSLNHRVMVSPSPLRPQSRGQAHQAGGTEAIREREDREGERERDGRRGAKWRERQVGKQERTKKEFLLLAQQTHTYRPISAGAPRTAKRDLRNCLWGTQN